MEKFKLPFPDLLNDLVKFSEDSALEAKVKRVYWRCIRSGRIAIADKIELKYPQYFKQPNDLVMAFGFSLIAKKAIKE